MTATMSQSEELTAIKNALQNFLLKHGTDPQFHNLRMAFDRIDYSAARLRQAEAEKQREAERLEAERKALELAQREAELHQEEEAELLSTHGQKGCPE